MPLNTIHLLKDMQASGLAGRQTDEKSDQKTDRQTDIFKGIRLHEQFIVPTQCQSVPKLLSTSSFFEAFLSNQKFILEVNSTCLG
jgi:hypothetical protein